MDLGAAVSALKDFVYANRSFTWERWRGSTTLSRFGHSSRASLSRPTSARHACA